MRLMVRFIARNCFVCELESFLARFYLWVVY